MPSKLVDIDLERILQASPSPTFVLNNEHKVVVWNPALEILSGIEARDILHTSNHWKPFYSERRSTMVDLLLSSPDSIPAMYEHVRASIAKNGFHAEKFFKKLNRWLHFTAAPIHNRVGEVVFAYETIEDITERRSRTGSFRE